MSNPARSDSLDSAENTKQVGEVVVKLLDLSINHKTNLMRCLVEKGEEATEERTLFCSVYDYLHHPEWRVAVSDEVTHREQSIVERARGHPTIISAIIEPRKGAIL